MELDCHSEWIASLRTVGSRLFVYLALLTSSSASVKTLVIFLVIIYLSLSTRISSVCYTIVRSKMAVSPSSNTTLYVLISLVSLGMGTLGGFGLFYHQYAHECASLLETTANLQEQDAESKLAECIAQERNQHQRLEKVQSEHRKVHQELAVQYESLQRTHEETLEKCALAESQLTETLQMTKTLTNELDEALEKCDPKQLVEMQKQLEKPFEALNQLDNLKTLIQQHSLGELYHQFGEEARPIVEFQLTTTYPNNPRQDDATHAQSSLFFRVQLFPSEYPMTTAIFLQLVRHGLYVGTTVAMHPPRRKLVGGHPSKSASTRIQSQLTRQSAVMGWGAEPFLWKEESRQSKTNSFCSSDEGMIFGFPSRSQQFQVTQTTTYDAPCHGRVIDMDSALWEDASSPNQESQTPPMMVITSVRILAEEDDEGEKETSTSSEEL